MRLTGLKLSPKGVIHVSPSFKDIFAFQQTNFLASRGVAREMFEQKIIVRLSLESKR